MVSEWNVSSNQAQEEVLQALPYTSMHWATDLERASLEARVWTCSPLVPVHATQIPKAPIPSSVLGWQYLPSSVQDKALDAAEGASGGLT